MSSIERPVDGTEPTDDDELWTCRFERQLTEVEQGKRVSVVVPIYFEPDY